MAYWWGSYPCTIDLLSASELQIRNAVRCRWPYFTVADRESEVKDLLALQSSLRAANTITQNVAAQIGGVTAAAAATTQAQLANLVGGANYQVAVAQNTLSKSLSDTIAKGSQANQSVIDKVIASVRGLADTASGLIGGAVNTVTTTVNSIVANVGGVVKPIVDGIGASIAKAVRDAQTTLSGIVAGIGQGVSGFLASAGEVVGGIVTTIKGVLADILRGLANAIGFLHDKLTGLPAALAELGDGLLQGIGDLLGGGVTNLADLLTDPLGGILGRLFEVEEGDLLDAVRPALRRASNAKGMPPEWRRVFAYIDGGGAPLVGIIGAILAVPLMMSAIQAVGGPFLELAHRESMAIARPTQLTLGDAISAYFRKEYSRGQLNQAAAYGGYSDADTAAAIDTARPLPAVVEVIEWLHRELLTEAGASELLSRMGFAPAQVANFIAAAPVIPPLSDLVHFAVREAFPGQVAYGGAAGAGVPAGFVDAAKKLGVDESFARSYWAAHWELPSVQQGFEMYHRAQIDRGRLESLLVQGDVMPEWREPLVAIAHNPLTRVDIRRMHEMGVLDDGAVHRAHLDLGYSEAHAGLLTRFVRELNTDIEDVKASSERDLSRGDIVGAYADGILSRPQATDYLGAIGYQSDESSLILDREDLRSARAKRADSRATIEGAAIVGVLNDEQAQDALSVGGFTATEQALALDRITAGRAARVAAPSRADLFRFRKAGIIDSALLKQGLHDIGYRDPWLSRYVALADKGQEPPN